MGSTTTTGTSNGLVLQSGAGIIGDCVLRATINDATLSSGGTAIVFGASATTGTPSYYAVCFQGPYCALYYNPGGGADTTVISASAITGTVAGTDYLATVVVRDNTVFVTTAGNLCLVYSLRDHLPNLSGYVGLRSVGGASGRLVKAFSVSSLAISTIYLPIAHGDFTAEFAMEVDSVGDGTGSLDFFFRLQSASSLANGYRMRNAAQQPFADIGWNFERPTGVELYHDAGRRQYWCQQIQFDRIKPCRDKQRHARHDACSENVSSDQDRLQRPALSAVLRRRKTGRFL